MEKGKRTGCGHEDHGLTECPAEVEEHDFVEARFSTMGETPQCCSEAQCRDRGVQTGYRSWVCQLVGWKNEGTKELRYRSVAALYFQLNLPKNML